MVVVVIIVANTDDTHKICFSKLLFLKFDVAGKIISVYFL